MMNEWMCYTHWFQQAGKMRRMLHDEKQRRRFDAILDQLMWIVPSHMGSQRDARSFICHAFMYTCRAASQ